MNFDDLQKASLERIGELERDLARARSLHDATCHTRPELERLRTENTRLRGQLAAMNQQHHDELKTIKQGMNNQ